MFAFMCHKDKKQAIHHVLKRTCFLARFQKGAWKLGNKLPSFHARYAKNIWE